MKLLRTPLLLTVLLATAPALFAQYTSPWADQRPALYWSGRAQLREAKVPAGVWVESVIPGTAAGKMDLRYGDLIVAIDDQKVTDLKSFAEALDPPKESATVSVFRYGELTTLQGTILPRFGATVSEYNYIVDSVLNRVENKDVPGATEILNQAEKKGTLSHKNLLIAKLLVLPDGNSDQVTQLASELSRILPDQDILNVWNLLSNNDHKFAAAAVMAPFAAMRPGDAGLQLDFALNLAQIQRNNEAEEIADKLVGSPIPLLSSYGFNIADAVLAMTAENRGNLDRAYQIVVQDLSRHPVQSNDIAMRLVYLAARQGNYVRFKEARTIAEKSSLAPGIMAPYEDALESYLLSRMGKKAEAKQLVDKWTEDSEMWNDVFEHWTKEFPAVAENWKTLR